MRRHSVTTRSSRSLSVREGIVGLLGQPVTQRDVVPQHEHQPDGRGEGIALTDPDADVRARRPDEVQHRDAVVDHRGQGGGGAGDRRQSTNSAPAAGSTRSDSWAMWPREIRRGRADMSCHRVAHQVAGPDEGGDRCRDRSAWTGRDDGPTPTRRTGRVGAGRGSRGSSPRAGWAATSGLMIRRSARQTVPWRSKYGPMRQLTRVRTRSNVGSADVPVRSNIETRGVHYTQPLAEAITEAERFVADAPFIESQADLLEGLQYLAGCIAACTHVAFDYDRDHPFLSRGPDRSPRWAWTTRTPSTSAPAWRPATSTSSPVSAHHHRRQLPDARWRVHRRQCAEERSGVRRPRTRHRVGRHVRWRFTPDATRSW